MNDHYFKCSCSNEILHVSYDNEIKTTEFSIYEMQNTPKASWRQKLRWCWRILIKGSPYGDQVILEKSQITNLIEYLTKIQNNECR